MKSNQQMKAKPININVNHIYHDFLDPEIELYYFETLNLFIFQYDFESTLEDDIDRIMVRELKRGKDKQLHFKENRLTRQMQSKIEQEYDQDDETPITFEEETEEIIIHQSNDRLKICTFKLIINKLQMEMRDYKNMNFQEIQAFEKYYISYGKNQVYIIRKNNMKIVLRQILKNPYFETQTQSFHLLLIGRGKDALFYKRSSQRQMKIIRKLRINRNIIMINYYYQGRYFAIQENLQLRIIDSTNMKQKQQNNLLNNESSVWNINQLGLFLISCESEDNLINQNSIQLQKDTLVQTIMVDKQLQFIKYSKSLGLLFFYDQE